MNLKVVDKDKSSDEPQYPDELHIRISYSADYAVASLYEGTELVAYSTGFESVETAGSWEAVRENLIEASRKRAAVIQKFGNPPKNEVVELGDMGNV